MKRLIVILTIAISLTASGQNPLLVGKYVCLVETDSLRGQKLQHDTLSMQVKLELFADSTYIITTIFDVKERCQSDDSVWYNTGRWMSQSNLVFFSIDKRTKEGYRHREEQYPIKHLDQGHFNLNRKELKLIREIDEKYTTETQEYPFHFLKFDEGGFLKCTYSWDCLEEIWKQRRLDRL